MPKKPKPAISAIIFDFDGVILESANIKTEAFLELFKAYPEHQKAIHDYHIENQGISRYQKFEWIYKTLLKKNYNDKVEQHLGKQFSLLVFEKIMNAPFVPGALELLDDIENKVPGFIASGTPDDELKEITKGRRIDQYFT